MKISVYITSYNTSEYLAKAINSVINQTLKPHELIIIDDFSFDDSRDIIESYKNKYPDVIIPIFNERNLGISQTRNIALHATSGDLITFVDGDDYYYPMKLENELLSLKNNINCHSVYSNFHYVSEIDEIQGTFSEPSDNPARGDIFKNVFGRNYKVTSGNNIRCDMFYKKCLEQTGYYDPEINLWEDWDFYIRFSKYYKYAYCSEINMVYRQHDKGLSKVSHRLHYKFQKKIYIKNKILLNDIDLNQRLYIISRIKKKLEGLLNCMLLDAFESKYFMKYLYYWSILFYFYKKKKYLKIGMQHILHKKIYNKLLISLGLQFFLKNFI